MSSGNTSAPGGGGGDWSTERRTTTTLARPGAEAARRWHGFDWFKTVVAGGLAAALIPWSGAAATPQPLPAPVAVEATALPTTAPTSAPTAAPASLPTTVPAPALVVPSLVVPGGSLAAGPVTLSGRGEPGSTVEVLVDGQPVGTATVGADGSWTLETVLAEGERQISVRSADAPTSASEPVAVTIGAAAGAEAPALPLALDPLPAGLAAGPVTLSGSGEPGSTVEVLVDGQPVGTATVGADGSWTLETVLAEGERQISLRTAGASEAAGEPVSVVIGGAAPVAGAQQLEIVSPLDGAEVPAGSVTISGTGTPQTAIEVLDSDAVVATTTVDDDGTWGVEVQAGDGVAAYGVREVGQPNVIGRPIRVVIGQGAETCAELAVGCQAWVTRAGDLRLRIREGAGTGGAVITLLEIGTQMELTEGPQPADGFSWFRVRTLGGLEGWVAGEQLVLQPD
jgi:hypothetical protein